MPRNAPRRSASTAPSPARAAAIGMLLGGVLTEYLSWRWTLYVNLVFAVVAFIGGMALLRKGAPAEPAQARHPRHRTGHRRPVRHRLRLLQRRDPRLGLPADLGLPGRRRRAWWRRSAGGRPDAAHPLLPLRVLLDRNRGASFAILAISGAGMFGVFLFLTYYLQLTLHYTPDPDRPGLPADDRRADGRRAAGHEPCCCRGSARRPIVPTGMALGGARHGLADRAGPAQQLRGQRAAAAGPDRLRPRPGDRRPR